MPRRKLKQTKTCIAARRRYRAKSGGKKGAGFMGSLLPMFKKFKAKSLAAQKAYIKKTYKKK